MKSVGHKIIVIYPYTQYLRTKADIHVNWSKADAPRYL